MLVWLLLAGCRSEEVDTESDELEIAGILLTPEELILPIGQSVQLSAIGLLENHETIDLTDMVEWNVEYYSVLSISEELDEEGTLTAIGEGESRIFAQYGDLRSSYSNATVTAASLERLSVIPDRLDLVEGDLVKLTATAYFSDGQTGDVTQQASWITGDGSVVQIEGDGEVLAIGVGETTVDVGYEGVQSDPVPVDVDPYYENGRPDLLVSSASGAVQSGMAVLDITIKNQGAKGASGFWVDLWIDPEEDPAIGDVGDHYQWVDYLGPNHIGSLLYEFPYSGESFSATALVDTNDDIDESHETNNLHSFATGTDDLQGPADLEVSHFDYYYDSDGTLTYALDITNSGREASGYFFAELYIDLEHAPSLFSNGEHFTAIENLAPSETISLEFYNVPICSGCSSWALLDSYGFVEESDESNNIGGPLLIEYDD
jgi:hypothetical protein